MKPIYIVLIGVGAAGVGLALGMYIATQRAKRKHAAEIAALQAQYNTAMASTTGTAPEAVGTPSTDTNGALVSAPVQGEIYQPGTKAPHSIKAMEPTA